MCKRGTTEEVIIDGKSFSIDSCIAEDVRLINKVGGRTLGSCCGHGIYPPTIIIKLKTGTITEYYSEKPIPRTRKFYRKDENGIYFLPEVRDSKSAQRVC